MTTKRHKIINNKTRKNKVPKPSYNILKPGHHLYASKSFEGSTILEYNKSEEVKYHDKCLIQNMSWFGNLKVAKSYKTKDTHIYRWKAKKLIKLLYINKSSSKFVDHIFKTTHISLVPTINISESNLKKVKYDHPYLKMSINERALYEFKFCFGFITVKEQYEFMLLIKYLIQNKITDIKRRNGKSILNKLKLKIDYYIVKQLLGNKKPLLNRLSFYDFDKHTVMNLCKLTNNDIYKIDGIYQKNDTSFWFPDLIVYKMDIQEYILFDPQNNLIYDKKIE